MPYLHDLPGEIIVIILRELQQSGANNLHPRTGYLCNLALASKQLLPLTQKVLYSKFCCCRGKEIWRLRSFLCTLIAQPTLASHVRYLTVLRWRTWDSVSRSRVEDSHWHAVEDETYSLAQHPRDRRLFQQAVRDLNLAKPRWWRDAVSTNVEDIYASLLILITPQLRRLTVAVQSEAVALDKALQHATATQSPSALVSSLQSLESVAIKTQVRKECLDSSKLAPLFCLPSIREMFLRDLPPLKVACAWPLSMAPNDTLRTLDLAETYSDTTFVSTIIGNCKHLEELRYLHDSGDPNDPDKSERTLRMTELGQALRNIGSTLRVLDLIIYGDSIGILGSLRECHHLQRVNVPLYLLLKLENDESTRLTDILPASVEEMTLGMVVSKSPTSSYTAIFSKVHDLVSEQGSDRSSLRTIHIRHFACTERSETPHPKVINALFTACRENNVKLLKGEYEEEFDERDMAEYG